MSNTKPIIELTTQTSQISYITPSSFMFFLLPKLMTFTRYLYSGFDISLKTDLFGSNIFGCKYIWKKIYIKQKYIWLYINLLSDFEALSKQSPHSLEIMSNMKLELHFTLQSSSGLIYIELWSVQVMLELYHWKSLCQHVGMIL